MKLFHHRFECTSLGALLVICNLILGGLQFGNTKRGLDYYLICRILYPIPAVRVFTVVLIIVAGIADAETNNIADDAEEMGRIGNARKGG